MASPKKPPNVKPEITQAEHRACAAKAAGCAPGRCMSDTQLIRPDVSAPLERSKLYSKWKADYDATKARVGRHVAKFVAKWLPTVRPWRAARNKKRA
jgi:hypothetical protein